MTSHFFTILELYFNPESFEDKGLSNITKQMTGFLK